jgi:hypothetical protein
MKRLIGAVMACAIGLSAHAGTVSGVPGTLDVTIYPAGISPQTAIFPSPSGLSSNGLTVFVPAIVGGCASLKLQAASVFHFAVKAPSGDFIFFVDAGFTPVSGSIPQGLTNATLATYLLPPIPMPSNGWYEWRAPGFPLTSINGAQICVSTSGTSIVPETATVVVTGERM